MFGRSDKKQMNAIEQQISANQQLYHRVFDGVDGQAVLKDLAKRCFENNTTYDESDNNKIFFNEGRRSVYKYITNLLNKDIKSMIEELTR